MKPYCHESESTPKQTHNNDTVLQSAVTPGASSVIDSKSQKDLSGKRNSSTLSSRPPDNSDTNNNTDTSVPIIVAAVTNTTHSTNKKPKIMTAVSEAETTSCTSTQNPDTDEIMDDKNNDDTALDPSIYHQISIELSTQEQKLCDTLEAVALAYENGTLHLPPKDNNDGTNNENSDEDNKNKKRSIEIRIAGGWVRDKILKQPSHDVDIALDSMSGFEFATLLQTYLRQQQEQEQEQQSNNNNDSKKKKNQKLPKIAVISANPSQSKHLETATMKIHTLDCDFVHLRGEEIYTSTSRIPTTSLATPLEDALRRDFTINSLFYNVRTKLIEDWTQRGLNDLIGKDAKLVTPMDASITFHDDPLRVLRAIRFGVRYDLPLCTHITNAARSVEVHESLHVKVSRERVGKELEGMLTGKGCKPDVALNLIADLKLAGCIFAFPSSMGGGVGGGGKKKEKVKGMLEGLEYNDDDDYDEEKNSHAREKGWLESTAMLNTSSHLLKPFQSNSNKDVDVDIDIRMFYLTTFLYPFRNLTVTDAKNKTYSLATYIIRDSIKYKNKDVQNVTTILQNVEKMKDVLQRVYLSSGVEGSGQVVGAFSRLEVGLLLRNVKELWPTTLLLAATAELRSRESDSSSENSQLILQATIKFYQDIVQNYNLDKCWKTRPLLDGKVMLEALDLPRGPEVGIYLEEQIHWMLLNPDGSKEECEVHLKDVRKRKLEEVAKGE